MDVRGVTLISAQPPERGQRTIADVEGKRSASVTMKEDRNEVIRGRSDAKKM